MLSFQGPGKRSDLSPFCCLLHLIPLLSTYLFVQVLNGQQILGVCKHASAVGLQPLLLQLVGPTLKVISALHAMWFPESKQVLVNAHRWVEEGEGLVF